MTPEEYYDAHVAPQLAALAKDCQANGLSFLAVCEWAPGEIGRTVALEAGSGIGIRIADAAAKANGNVDSLLMAISKHARTHGHSSAYLHSLGIPTQPAAPPANPLA